MSYNVLGPKQTRKYRRLLGLPGIERIITRGGTGHRFDFRTYDHRHGSFWFEGYGERKGHWNHIFHDDNPFHWTTCIERFPEEFDPVTHRYIGPPSSAPRSNGVG